MKRKCCKNIEISFTNYINVYYTSILYNATINRNKLSSFNKLCNFTNIHEQVCKILKEKTDNDELINKLIEYRDILEGGAIYEMKGGGKYEIIEALIKVISKGGNLYEFKKAYIAKVLEYTKKSLDSGTFDEKKYNDIIVEAEKEVTKKVYVKQVTVETATKKAKVEAAAEKVEAEAVIKKVEAEAVKAETTEATKATAEVEEAVEATEAAEKTKAEEAEAAEVEEAKATAKAATEAIAEAATIAKAEAEAIAKAEAEAEAIAIAKAKATAEEAEAAEATEAAEKTKAEEAEAAEVEEAIAKAKAVEEAIAKAEAEVTAKAKAEAEAIAIAKAKATAKAATEAIAEAEAIAKAEAEAEAIAKAEAQAEEENIFNEIGDAIKEVDVPKQDELIKRAKRMYTDAKKIYTDAKHKSIIDITGIEDALKNAERLNAINKAFQAIEESNQDPTDDMINDVIEMVKNLRKSNNATVNIDNIKIKIKAMLDKQWKQKNKLQQISDSKKNGEYDSLLEKMDNKIIVINKYLKYRQKYLALKAKLNM